MDDFAVEDLRAHEMSAVNPDYFMALRFSEAAYRVGVTALSVGTRNPPRTEADTHRLLGRRHPHLLARFCDAYPAIPAEPDPDQPGLLFRGAICVRCAALLTSAEESRLGLCEDHLPTRSHWRTASRSDRSQRPPPTLP